MLIPWVERFCPLVTRTCGGFLLNCLKEITYTTVCRRDGTAFLRQQWLFTRFIFVMQTSVDLPVAVKVTHFISIQIKVLSQNIDHPYSPSRPPPQINNGRELERKPQHCQLRVSMGLTMSRKREKNLASRRKSHYSIETLLACFRACPLYRSSFMLELRNVVSLRGGKLQDLKIYRKTLGLRREQTTNSIHMWHLVRIEPSLAIGGNGTRRLILRIRHPCCRWDVFIILIEFSSCLCASEGNMYVQISRKDTLSSDYIFSLKNLISLYLIKSLDIVGNKKKD